ncbi:hypothetical protein ACQP2P_40020 [Dactylosporangium sp. CA-139114]|uniref:hypothetical protein n=1 Tax=Dactylosporangium sp. CA-139114 TaxID=3239931 RepID=UPI003D95C18C
MTNPALSARTSLHWRGRLVELVLPLLAPAHPGPGTCDEPGPHLERDAQDETGTSPTRCRPRLASQT